MATGVETRSIMRTATSLQDHPATRDVACPRAVATVGAPAAVADALARQLGEGPFAAVLVFAAPGVDRAGLAAALQSRFGTTPVLGCTTAGEIGPDGLSQETVTAVGLPASHVRVASELVPDVTRFGLTESRDLVRRATARLAREGVRPTGGDTFALVFVDGLVGVEEQLVSSLDSTLGDIALVGGSAGDGLNFRATHVFADGAAHQGAAVVALVQTTLPFEVFKTQHFAPGEVRCVVTSADPERRIVHEFDGEPAASWLANALGLDERDLGPTVFATHPVVVRIGGADYVRSIQRVEGEHGLKFFCAIEEGIVLRLATGVGLVANLEQTMQAIAKRIGPPLLTLSFDCILRGLECRREGVIDAVSQAMAAGRFVGFSTYGEQFRGMHVNQTLTGVVLGHPEYCG